MVHRLYRLIGEGGYSVLKGQCLQSAKNNILPHAIQQPTALSANFTNGNSRHSYHDHVFTTDLTNKRGFFIIPHLHLYKFASFQGYNILENSKACVYLMGRFKALIILLYGALNKY